MSEWVFILYSCENFHYLQSSYQIFAQAKNEGFLTYHIQSHLEFVLRKFFLLFWKKTKVLGIVLIIYQLEYLASINEQGKMSHSKTSIINLGCRFCFWYFSSFLPQTQLKSSCGFEYLYESLYACRKWFSN